MLILLSILLFLLLLLCAQVTILTTIIMSIDSMTMNIKTITTIDISHSPNF